MNCLYCGNPITGKGIKYCSQTCQKKANARSWYARHGKGAAWQKDFAEEWEKARMKLRKGKQDERNLQL